MDKKIIAALLIAFVFVVSGCNKQNDVVATTEVLEADTTKEATTEETEYNVTTPGLGLSEFDDETEPTVEETQPQTEATEPAETTKPTEAPKPSETTPPTEAPKPSETTPPTETPQPETKPKSEYETFQNMSAADQQAHMESFDSMDAFFDWYNNAKAEYEAANPPIDIGNGSIDMGDLMG